MQMQLDEKQIQSFREQGYIVIPNVLTAEEIIETRQAFHETLRKNGVDANNLETTAGNLRELSTTGGAGGVLDIFYAHWKLKICEHPNVFSVISQLWNATWSSGNDKLYPHPHGQFDPKRGHFYINRVCFRVPDHIAKTHKKSKKTLQRCLAPHLDCCPLDLFGTSKKYEHIEVPTFRRWRPIQMFVALTDNDEENTGGFECVPGFHKEFENYFRKKSVKAREESKKDTVCVGEFCRLLPKEDEEILKRFTHVPYQAGSAVLWDWRIPHANARYNRSKRPREVIYTGFLPDVPINRAYAKDQREKYLANEFPTDHWGREEGSKCSEKTDYIFSPLGERLLGIVSWDIPIPPPPRWPRWLCVGLALLFSGYFHFGCS